MTADGHTVVDVDAHFLDSAEGLADYLDDDDPWTERFREAKMSMVPQVSPDLYRAGRIKRDDVGYPVDGEGVVDVMEYMDFDKIVMLPMAALFITGAGADDRRAELMARGFTEFMLDDVVDPGRGVYSLIPMPQHDPEAAVELIEKYGDEPGLPAICLSAPGSEPPLGNRRYDGIYEAAQSKDLTVVVHGGGSGLDDFHRKGYSRFIESHSLGFVETNMEQLTSIVIQGVPEKFPELDFVFQESGVLWVAAYMYRLDQEYLKRQDEAPLLEKLPSEYVQDVYFGTQPLERPGDPEYFEKALRTIGTDSLMFASDFPHWDFDPPSAITDLDFLTADEKAAVLGGNAEEVFGI